MKALPGAHGKRHWEYDCTHFCYTPLFYDATVLTPLHAMLLAHGDAESDSR